MKPLARLTRMSTLSYLSLLNRAADAREHAAGMGTVFQL
jgi:hypothetical protein